MSYRKRKEMEGVYVAKRSFPLGCPAPATTSFGSNHILAGYMAHEFLTRGTVLGRKWDPDRPVCSGPTDPDRVDPDEKESGRQYVDVANLLKREKVHIPGIINPTQLAQWLKM